MTTGGGALLGVATAVRLDAAVMVRLAVGTTLGTRVARVSMVGSQIEEGEAAADGVAEEVELRVASDAGVAGTEAAASRVSSPSPESSSLPMQLAKIAAVATSRKWRRSKVVRVACDSGTPGRSRGDC